MSAFARLKTWARTMKRDVHALYLCARDRRVPASAKILAGFVAAYALSPIDLIPDFIPVLGYLDDLVLVPLGIWLALRLIPLEILAEHRRAAETHQAAPISRTAAIVVMVLWLLGAAGLAWFAWRAIMR